ncbi:YwmB family TATA-box binding protein [Bacillus thuringiensis]|uniref:YwmB family TATA-box binding protein n=1 Tax=Bacillus thuringiensis TaxID=1428 RepID=UPI003BFA6E4D
MQRLLQNKTNHLFKHLSPTPIQQLQQTPFLSLSPYNKNSHHPLSTNTHKINLQIPIPSTHNKHTILLPTPIITSHY